MMKRITAGLIVLGIAFNAAATPITIDFEGMPPQNFFVDFTIQGMRFSPRCPAFIHFDRFGSNGTYLAVDPANNCGAASNRAYLGDGNLFDDLWIDAEGKPFSLLGLDSKVAFFSRIPFVIRSSKGGVFNSQIAPGNFTLTGPQWTDITWFTLRGLEDSFHKQHGWDNIRLDIPDPESSAVPPVKLKKPGKKPKPKKSWFMFWE